MEQAPRVSEGGLERVAIKVEGSACGPGPGVGWYTLAWMPGAMPPAWGNTPTVWHYRRAGVTVCGAHNGPATALRTDASYVVAAQPPVGAQIHNRCAALAREGA